MASTSPQPPSGFAPDTSNRRKHPCVLCQQRKVKCDRTEPCANCTRAKVECISPTTLPQKKRKKRFAEAELLAKLRRYEDHLRAYGANLDAINSGGILALPVPIDPKQNDEDSSVDQDLRLLAIRQEVKHTNHTQWTGVSEELRDAEDMLAGSSEDEMYAKPITRTFDAIHSDGGDLLFYIPTNERMIDLHPPTVQIFRLWQTFLDNVNPIVKLFHAPTIQIQILEASTDLENVSKEMEALMFGIYATAVSSLSDSECISMFGEEKESMRSRYSAGARQALHRAGLMRSSNMTILQGYVLYLVSCLNFHIDPRSLFCLTGIAVRMAQRMGLCYDGSGQGLRPFEIEMRRRLWWQIMLIDLRVAEFSGGGYSILTYNWTTKFPLNVNDSDLYPDMRTAPPEHKGATEMLYVLLLCETMSHFHKMTASQEPLAIKDKEIDDLVTHLNKTYLQYCDPSIPLHALSIFMSGTRIAKLRLGPRHPRFLPSKSINTEDKDMLFGLSLQMLQNNNTLMRSNAMKHFFWHIVINVPFPAHVYLLVSLKTRSQDEMADKAWAAFEEFYQLRIKLWDRRETNKPKHSAVHAALANLTVKAWDAREKSRPGIEVPEVIVKLKEEVKAKKSQSKGASAEMETPPNQAEAGSHGDMFTENFSWMNQPVVDFGQTTDFGSGPMSGILTGQDNSSMGLGWEFWNDLMPVNGTQGGNGQAYNGPNMYNS